MTPPIITYKPGWTFEWSADGLLQVTIQDYDTTTGEPIVTSTSVNPPTPFDPAWLRDWIAGLEAHERIEWLKVDGVKPFDPHATTAPIVQVIASEDAGTYDPTTFDAGVVYGKIAAEVQTMAWPTGHQIGYQEAWSVPNDLVPQLQALATTLSLGFTTDPGPVMTTVTFSVIR